MIKPKCAKTGARKAKEVPEPIRSNATEKGPDSLQKNLRVLIVDDEVPIHRSLARMMKRKLGECSISGAENGKTAMELLEREDFGLILLDLDMPEMKGTDVVRALKESGREDLIDKVVIHSASACSDLNPDVNELVGGRLLEKTGNMDELLEVLEFAKEGRVKEWKPAPA
ncbi:response regulator [Candidatus Micrarchaeota archaeon]|nr:response regulator [Candidatus Micrarchaeota archaeon]MBD3418402.1 response regulator [Candidatus Micrarchaeota archaeon]